VNPNPSIAVIGATGAVGRELLTILEQRRFPHSGIRMLASARSAGTKVPFKARDHTVEELGPNSFQGIDLAFFAAGSDTAKAFAPKAVAAGAVAIDKSSAHRAAPDIPLCIPEINPETISHLKAKPGIVAVPNCSTIIMLVPLEPLRRAFGIDRIAVSTYQAASGAGAAAMAELESQTVDVLAGKAAVPRVFKEPCAFNVFSHDSTIDATGFNGEEAKLASETRKIWNDPSVKVNATCVRVGVMRGHSEAITVTLRKPATEREVREALAAGKGLQVVDDRAANRFPTPLKASGGDPVLVGRIRPDYTQASEARGGATAHFGWNLFVSGDQLRKGAALNAVQIAEMLLKGSS